MAVGVDAAMVRSYFGYSFDIFQSQVFATNCLFGGPGNVAISIRNEHSTKHITKESITKRCLQTEVEGPAKYAIIDREEGRSARGAIG